MRGLLGCLAIALVAIGVLAGPSAAQLELAPVFGDHMLFQRDRPIPLWGVARPGAEVVASGTDVSTLADDTGLWRLELPARVATREPFAIELSSDGVALRLEDLLVGELWICAGQSNMELAVSRSLAGKDILAGQLPQDVRLYQASYTATGAGGVWDAAKVQGLDRAAFHRGSWSRADGGELASMSAVGFYFGRALSAQLDMPVGLIDLAAGGTPTEAWIPRAALANDPDLRDMVEPGSWLENPTLDEWCRERAGQNLGRALASAEQVPGDDLGPNHAFKPAFLWDTAAAPFADLPVGGVVWYQGESNASSPRRIAQHARLFPLLVKAWRDAVGEERMPFLYVQLPAMGRADWPAFREQQRGFLTTLERVAMAVTIDVGHPTDVHPRAKQPVGERLAALAVELLDGASQATTGPMLLEARREGDLARLRFLAEEGGLSTSDGAPPTGFEWIAEDGTTSALVARIEGSELLLELPSDSSAGELTYAWAPVPTCNLVDAAGMPASPFRVRPTPVPAPDGD